MSEASQTPAASAAKKQRARKAATRKGSRKEMLRLRLAKSGIATPKDQKATIHALGFRWVGDVVERPDTPEVRGRIRKIAHLVEILAG
ncbi:MAG TPA: 50S ribosomal protein L30 [Thermoanaerobaculia bacterium]|jgi:large subunit ribosomal protein L30|nr:50S ribosomal protein L30 [Thermoanaerobaculia bacterium]